MRVQAYGHYNLVIRIYGHQNVVSFSEISQDLTNRHHRLIEDTTSFPKPFDRLKIGPLLRKLQAFKDWQYFDFY